MAEFYYRKSRLRTPGPTPILSDQEDHYHRSEEFAQIFLRCRKLLAPLFGCSEPPVILSSSGTGAMEACLMHLCSPGDRVLVVEGGKFGQRWVAMAERFGLDVHTLKVKWGEAVCVAQIHDHMSQKPVPRVVFFQASETSTGVYHPVKTIAVELRQTHPEVFIVVDGISSVGAHPMKMNRWGIDGVVSGSQKGFGIPPGLSFVALSERALLHNSSQRRFYFDLIREYKNQSRGHASWTPAISLVCQLLKTLEYWHQVGLDAVYTQHEQASQAMRSTLEMMGIELFTQNPSYALTSFKVPCGVCGLKLLTHLQQHYGVVCAGGQEHLKGQIVRIAHLGFFDRLDLMAGLAALEMSFADLGLEIRSGLAYLADQLRVSSGSD